MSRSMSQYLLGVSKANVLSGLWWAHVTLCRKWRQPVARSAGLNIQLQTEQASPQTETRGQRGCPVALYRFKLSVGGHQPFDALPLKSDL